MEYAAYINNMTQLDNLTSATTRVYFGEEFCSFKLPNKTVLKSILREITDRKLDFTFLTPYATAQSLDEIERLIRYIHEQISMYEVVVNDYGVMTLIYDLQLDIIPVYGRLLNKTRRDPRIKLIIGRNTEQDTGQIFNTYNAKGDDITNLLRQFNIARLEFDNLLHGWHLELPGNFHGTVYYPFVYLTTTRLCRLNDINLYSMDQGLRIPDKCNQKCRNVSLAIFNNEILENIYIKGNTQFLFNNQIDESVLQSSGIDRLVYQFKL